MYLLVTWSWPNVISFVVLTVDAAVMQGFLNINHSGGAVSEYL